eukprot:6205954-Pleurochrysis_carterae.AAC.1
MDDKLATMTPSARLTPVHALLHAMPEAPDSGAGKAARRAAQQLNVCKEAPGSKANLVRYDGQSGMTGSPSTRSATSWVTTSACRPRGVGQFRAAQGLWRMPRAFVLTNNPSPSPPTASAALNISGRQARAGFAAEVQRLEELASAISSGRSWSPS